MSSLSFAAFLSSFSLRRTQLLTPAGLSFANVASGSSVHGGGRDICTVEFDTPAVVESATATAATMRTVGLAVGDDFGCAIGLAVGLDVERAVGIDMGAAVRPVL